VVQARIAEGKLMGTRRVVSALSRIPPLLPEPPPSYARSPYCSKHCAIGVSETQRTENENCSELSRTIIDNCKVAIDAGIQLRAAMTISLTALLIGPFCDGLARRALGLSLPLQALSFVGFTFTSGLAFLQASAAVFGLSHGPSPRCYAPWLAISSQHWR
jgi:hypothetical protein